MLEQTKSYGNQARDFGHNNMDIPFSQHHPWVERDSPRSVPRHILYELENSSLQLREQSQQFGTARDLHSYLMESRSDRSNSNTRKQLIILEDIDPRFAEVLGVMLEIPPPFLWSIAIIASVLVW